MIDEKEFRQNFATALANTKAARPNRPHGEKGTHFDSRHRVARMLRFVARHGSPALVARLVRMQRREKVRMHARFRKAMNREQGGTP